MDFTLNPTAFQMQSTNDSHQKRSDNLSSFGGQKVECPTCSLGIHGFHTNACCIKVLQATRMQEPDSVTASKNDKLGLQSSKHRKVLWHQLLERWTFPSSSAQLRAHKYAAAELLPIHADPSGAIAGNAMAIGRVWQEFHFDVLVRVTVGKTRRSGGAGAKALE
jgi:hypothetical protein